jgi:SAM-dependent methyltransferase
MDHETISRDYQLTIDNYRSLPQRQNLLYWYQRLYEELLGPPEAVANLKILEVGSGVSPLKRFCPNVITSDVLPLAHVDLVLDAHELGDFGGIADQSLDVITATNVLHHMKDPVRFLVSARKKLKPGGRVALAEPYFSALSRLIYVHLHHEATEFAIQAPQLNAVEGPLTSANLALSHLIFWGRRGWDQEVLRYYLRDTSREFFFTCMTYFATGGISHKIPIPQRLFRALWGADKLLAQKLPELFASFFCVSLVRKP